jgi:hypothetical protein
VAQVTAAAVEQEFHLQLLVQQSLVAAAAAAAVQ